MDDIRIKASAAVLYCLFAMCPAGPVSAESLEEHNVLAALTLNIVRFTSWPAGAFKEASDNITLCLIGDNIVQQAFENIKHKGVGNKRLNVVFLSRLRNFESCQVLYISELKRNILLQVIDEVKNLPVLTIGESNEFAHEGGMVGMENVRGKIQLTVNLSVVKVAGLTISSRLLKLATVIGETGVKETK